MPASNGLTAKQRAFVDEYIVDFNATAAAERAGYSSRTASSTGSVLLKKPNVSEAIAAAMAARSERTKIDADWLLRRLAEEADADLADLYDENGALKLVMDWPPVWRKGLVAGVDVEEIQEDRKVVGVVRKVKLSDRLKRLELIGKHVDVQAFREKVELTGKDGEALQVEVIQRDADEFARRVAGLVAAGAAGSGTGDTST